MYERSSAAQRSEELPDDEAGLGGVSYDLRSRGATVTIASEITYRSSCKKQQIGDQIIKTNLLKLKPSPRKCSTNSNAHGVFLRNSMWTLTPFSKGKAGEVW